jgi:aspartyl-tRNA(Asn)/glutamyl-tRNA(Gln) amidotransferase subunit C
MLGSAHQSADFKTGHAMPLDRAAVAHIATLARIKVPEKDLDALARELDHILHWVEQLNEVDTSNIEPMTGAVRMALPRRKDEVTDGNCRDDILANAPEKTHGFFVVPKVVEPRWRPSLPSPMRSTAWRRTGSRPRAGGGACPASP